jgi:hypothetical protein
MIPAVAAIPFRTFRLSILGKKLPLRALSSSLLVMVRFLCFSIYSGLLAGHLRYRLLSRLVMGMQAEHTLEFLITQFIHRVCA